MLARHELLNPYTANLPASLPLPCLMAHPEYLTRRNLFLLALSLPLPMLLFYKTIWMTLSTLMQQHELQLWRERWHSSTCSGPPTRLSTKLMLLRYNLYTCDCDEVPADYNILQKIRKWFYNRIDPPRRQYTKFTRRWAARSVFHQLNRDEIIELAKETSGLIPGHPQFLGALQNATTALWNALAPDDRDDYCKAAKEWSDDTPPKHIQSRYVIGHCMVTADSNPIKHVEWHSPCANGLSKTFKSSCTRYAVSRPLSFLPIKTRTTNWPLACESSNVLLYYD
jgi:hypothetical protein